MGTGEDRYKLLSLFSNTDTFYTTLLQKQGSTWGQERIGISCLACSPILILFILRFYKTGFNMGTGEDRYKLLSLFSNTDTFYTMHFEMYVTNKTNTG